MHKIIITVLLCATFTVSANSLFESGASDLWDKPMDFDTKGWNSINVDICDSSATGNILQATIQGSGNTLYIDSEQMNNGNINASSNCADISITAG